MFYGCFYLPIEYKLKECDAIELSKTMLFISIMEVTFYDRTKQGITRVNY